MTILDRRILMAGGAAASLTPSAAAAGPYEDPETRALATYSESAMVMMVAAQPDVAFTLRFCRFPDAGVTWLWCHALVDGRLLAFTHHRLATTPERLHGRSDLAAFAAQAPFRASLIRQGPATAVQTVAFDVDLPVHASNAAPHGPGPVALRVSGTFTPARGLPASLGDRQELMGKVASRLTVNGRSLDLVSDGKFHEQSQMRPRFVDPFAYFGFWGATVGGMFLRARNPSGGLVDARSARPVTEYAVDRPGRLRRVAATLSTGEKVTGELTALSRFSIPIFGERWRGSFVRGRVAGAPVSGMLNDWRPDQVAYL